MKTENIFDGAKLSKMKQQQVLIEGMLDEMKKEREKQRADDCKGSKE